MLMLAARPQKHWLATPLKLSKNNQEKHLMLKFKTFNMPGFLVRSLALSLCIVGASAIAVAGSDDTQGTSRTPFDQIEWETQPSGRVMANIKGDFKTGPHIKFIKFQAGAKTPPHIHSYDYVGIVVKGTARHYEPGKPETMAILPAGSNWSISANVPDISECLPGEDCIFVTQSDGPFDVKPVK